MEDLEVALYDYGYIEPDSSSVRACYAADGSVQVDLWSETFYPDGVSIYTKAQGFTWRDFVVLLTDLDEGGDVDADAFRSIAVTGVTGIQALALKCAWVEGGGELALWLASQSDKSLAVFGEQICALAKNPREEVLVEFISIQESLSLPIDLIEAATELGVALTAPDSLARIIEASDEQLDEKIERNRLDSAAKLAPFIHEIASIASQFDDRRISGGGILAPSKRQTMYQWLEDYCQAHSALPTGKHEVSLPFLGNSRRSLGVVDFDEIRQLL